MAGCGGWGSGLMPSTVEAKGTEGRDHPIIPLGCSEVQMEFPPFPRVEFELDWGKGLVSEGGCGEGAAVR